MANHKSKSQINFPTQNLIYIALVVQVISN